MQDRNAGRQKCEVYTRVMGYHRPVNFFNEGKKSEFYSRKYFNPDGTAKCEYQNANDRFTAANIKDQQE